RQEQWRGSVYSDVIFAAGFAIFVLSDFPPTQRFGVVVLAGLLIDILANLFVLPLLGGAEWKKRRLKCSLEHITRSTVDCLHGKADGRAGNLRDPAQVGHPYRWPTGGLR